MKRFLCAVAAALSILTIQMVVTPIAFPRPAIAQTATTAVAPAPSAGTTITTTAPVTADTKISVGTLAGEVLTWLAAAFSIPIGGLLTAWLMRAFKLAGVQTTQQMSDQLNATLVNGLNAAASRANVALQGQVPIAIKNQIVADAVAYAQAHRSETIKALGLDPQSGKAVEALKARIATLSADPTVPTPALAPVGKPAAA